MNELIKKKNNNNNKLLLILGIVLVVGLTIVIIVNKNNIFKSKKVSLNDKPIVEKINVDSKINEITVVESRIEKLGKLNNIYIKIKNNTNKEIDKSNLKLTIYDKDNIILLISSINDVEKFNIGEEREVQVATDNDISNASKYIVEKE